MRFTPWVIYAILCLLFEDLDVARQQVLVLLNDCDLRYQLLVVRRCCPVSELFPRHIVPEVDRKGAAFVRKTSSTPLVSLCFQRHVLALTDTIIGKVKKKAPSKRIFCSRGKGKGDLRPGIPWLLTYHLHHFFKLTHVGS